MEALICLPLLLLVSLATAQFAHIWLCRVMVHYAAYTGARAALTAAPGSEKDRAGTAAKAVCSSLAFFDPTAGKEDLSLPGIFFADGEKIDGSAAVESESILKVDAGTHPDRFHVYADVTMKVPLLMPLAGPVIARYMRLYRGTDYAPSERTPEAGSPFSFAAGDLWPRIALNEKVYMARPFLATWSGN